MSLIEALGLFFQLIAFILLVLSVVLLYNRYVEDSRVALIIGLVSQVIATVFIFILR